MSPEDIEIFFSPGDPGIEEAFYQNSDDQPQSVHGEFINHSKEHKVGARQITQKKPGFKLPEVHAASFSGGMVLEIKGHKYEIAEILTVATGICLMHLIQKSDIVDSDNWR